MLFNRLDWNIKNKSHLRITNYAPIPHHVDTFLSALKATISIYGLALTQRLVHIVRCFSDSDYDLFLLIMGYIGVGDVAAT